MRIRGWVDGREPVAVFFEIAWRLTVLALPWQTRWFNETNLAGWPWEQGSLAFYVSWLPLVATIAAGYFNFKTAESETDQRPVRKVPWAVFGLLFVSAAAVAYTAFMQAEAARAVFQWWIQVGLLAAFCLVLRKNRVDRRQFVSMAVLAVVPQILLVFYQYAVQYVGGASWLGMAGHSPKQLGVSVVEFSELRYLRAYGGMPHPNIMGGWLATCLFLTIWSAWQATDKKTALAYMIAAGVCSGALVLTFSRSAFLAAAVGAGALLVLFIRGRKKGNIQFGLAAMVCAVAFAAVLGLSQREVLLARTQGQNRLETKSMDARQRSLDDGWSVFRLDPAFGSGSNAELAALWRLRRSAADTERKSSEPLESPHNSWELALVDFGCLGSALILYLLFCCRRSLARSWYAWLPILVLLWLDHYAWSYWSGQVLVAMIAAFVISSDKRDADFWPAVRVDATAVLD